MSLLNIATFIVGCIILIASGSLLLKSLSKIAVFLRVSEYVVSFIILAFATSTPELFVGIASALNKNTALALGTIMGSNIADLTLIIGIPVLLAKGINIRSEKTKKDAMYMVPFAALPLILMLIGNSISRTDGIILVATFFIYVYKVYKERKEFRKEFKENVKRWEVIMYTAGFFFSLIILFLSSKIVVNAAGLLAIDFALPPIMIGLFIIALGTTLPELVVGSSAALKGHSDISVGNIIGSVIANSTFILGVTSIIYPITSNFLLFITSGVYMILLTVIFATFARSEAKLDWTEGLSLVMLYAFFVVLEFYIKITI